ncbi:MAG: hypothetical protein V9E90_01405 [Saprospiraceae bacterium]
MLDFTTPEGIVLKEKLDLLEKIHLELRQCDSLLKQYARIYPKHIPIIIIGLKFRFPELFKLSIDKSPYELLGINKVILVNEEEK